MMRPIWVAVIGMLVAGACVDGGSATKPSSAQATTTNVAGIPLHPTVGSLAWTGTVAVDSRARGVSSQLAVDVSGSFVGPGQHRLTVSGESTTDDVSEPLAWEATIVGARAWVREEGDLRAFAAEGVADEYMTVLATATGCVIPSSALLADLVNMPPARYEDRNGRSAAVFEILDAPLASYAPLFASDFALAFGGSVQTADVTLVVDRTSGLVSEGRLVAGGDGIDVEVAFTVTAFDDPSIVIAEDLVVPEPRDLVPYEEPGGRFTVAYPATWDIDEFERGVTVGPPFTAEDVYASVVVIPAATIEEVIGAVLADASPGTEVLEREALASGGLDFERLILGFSQGEELLQARVWLTVVGDAGYALQVVTDEREADRFRELAEAMFVSFRPGGV
jgi:hypothetical protein